MPQFAGSEAHDRRAAGAEGVRSDGSYYDPEFKAYVVPVVLGHHRISSRADDMLVTTLGSCIAACLHDPVTRVGGMNHFLLPGAPSEGGIGLATRYGGVAMERLINDLLTRGAHKERLEVKLFGGARVIESSMDIGVSNAAFVLDFVQREGLRLTGSDLGGSTGRRVHFFPTTGKAMRRLVRPETERETVSQELDYLRALKQAPLEGDVEVWRR